MTLMGTAPLRPHARSAPPADAAAKPGTVRTETLPNGVRIVIAERPGASATRFQIGIGAGSLQDPVGKLGLAHLLEHLAFEGSPTRSASQQERLRSQLGNDWNASTDRTEVRYYGVVPAQDAVEGAALITDMFRNPATKGLRVAQELAAVRNEMVAYDGTLDGQSENIAERLVYGDGPATNNIIGTRSSTGAITPTDLREFHRSYFVGRNTVVLVDGDPERLALGTIRHELGALPAGARVDNSDVKRTIQPGRALQVVNEASTSTVALDVLVPIAEAHLKRSRSDAAKRLLVSSIGSRLHERLRRVDHLTYGTDVTLEPGSDTGRGQALLRVRTNVAAAHAAPALGRIVETLKDAIDGFGPKTFDRDLAELRARLRAQPPDVPPTTSQLAEATFDRAFQGPRIKAATARELTPTSRASLHSALERLTLETAVETAANLISLDNLKVVAIGALPDGGGALLDALRGAGIPSASVTRNPVDLSQYREMGIAVPKGSTPPVRPSRRGD